MPYPINDPQRVGATLPANVPPWNTVSFPPQEPLPSSNPLGSSAIPPSAAPQVTPTIPESVQGPGLVDRITDPKTLLAFIIPLITGMASRGSGGMLSAGALMQGMVRGYLTAQDAKWKRMEFEGQAEQAKFERETLLMKMVNEGSAHIADLADDPTQQTIFYRQFSEYLENAPAFRGHEDLVRRGLMRPPANAGSRAVAKAADKLVEKLDKDNPAWRENPENLVTNITDPVLRSALGAQTAAKNLLAARTTATTPEGGRLQPKKKLPTSLEDALIEADASGNQAEVTRLLKLIERKGEAGRMPPAEKGYQWVTRKGKVFRVSEGEIREGDLPFSTREGMRAVTSGDAGRIAEFNTALDDVKVLKLAISGGATGTRAYLGTWVPNWATELTGWGTGAKAKLAVIARVKQVIGKALEGGVLRKEDEIKYEAILPIISDVEEVVQAKLDGLKDALTLRQQRTLEALEDAGYDISKFATPAPQGVQAPPISADSKPGEIVTLPDGRVVKIRERTRTGFLFDAIGPER